jgi:diacylglycerol kinase
MRDLAALGSWQRTARDAWRGVARTWREEPTFRVQAVVGAFALALSLWLGTGVLVVVAFGALVLSLELVNTALERLADAVHPGHHPLVGAAKDASAGAVVVAAAAALLAGLIVLGPPLVTRLTGAA